MVSSSSSNIISRVPRSVAIVPFEIWRECFMSLSTMDHKNLAKTCHFFRDICLPFIFRSITYCSDLVVGRSWCPGPTSDIDEHKEYIKRFKQFAQNSKLAPLVRKCALLYSLELQPEANEKQVEAVKDDYDQFVMAFAMSLSSFINLRELLINFDRRMDKRILAAFALLPNLEQITFTSAKFGVHFLKSRIRARRLIIDNSRQDRNPNSSAKCLDLFSGNHLESIQALSRNYAPKLFKALTSQGKSTRLTDLTFQLKPQDIDILYLFLATCPNLLSLTWHADLTFTGDDIHSVSLPPLPHSTIPCLQTFHGIGGAAEVCTPGLPVYNATICSDFFLSITKLEAVLQKLSLTTSPITNLTLEFGSCSPEHFDLIKKYVPQLETLHVVLPSSKVFADEDPHHISLSGTDEGVGSQKGDSLSIPDFQPLEPLLPILAHAFYMNVLHWIAHRKINLPPSLKTLRLDSRYCRYEHLKDTASQIAKCGRPYTFSTAHSILGALSIDYPSFECVQVHNFLSKEELRWSKTNGGNWTYSGVLELCSSGG
ncbi:hypothetical protein GALMADRAFT_160610 [Galerina marginata CBS 339.88]|uniref:F-box domain-containing protein n=1 Tax=Galerina marginata (strain CBS 339.88) TaxID=685588 RepID=A0A067SNR8_GALM3|nr:hypothetical protein GALMADRAFT_160610 [Galerina marginata CBS 339.88]